MWWKMLFPTWLNSLKSHYNTPTCSIQIKYFLKTRITFPALVVKGRLTLYQLFRLSTLNLPKGAVNLPLFCLLYWGWHGSMLAYPALLLFLQDTSTGLAAFPEKGQLLVNSSHCLNSQIPSACPQLPVTAALVQRRVGAWTMVSKTRSVSSDCWGQDSLQQRFLLYVLRASTEWGPVSFRVLVL